MPYVATLNPLPWAIDGGTAPLNPGPGVPLVGVVVDDSSNPNNTPVMPKKQAGEPAFNVKQWLLTFDISVSFGVDGGTANATNTAYLYPIAFDVTALDKTVLTRGQQIEDPAYMPGFCGVSSTFGTPPVSQTTEWDVTPGGVDPTPGPEPGPFTVSYLDQYWMDANNEKMQVYPTVSIECPLEFAGPNSNNNIVFLNTTGFGNPVTDPFINMMIDCSDKWPKHVYTLPLCVQIQNDSPLGPDPLPDGSVIEGTVTLTPDLFFDYKG